jgi:hypothetical protein
VIVPTQLTDNSDAHLQTNDGFSHGKSYARRWQIHQNSQQKVQFSSWQN